MTELKIEHVLILVIVAFVIYHLSSCRCSNNGFSVGGGGVVYENIHCADNDGEPCMSLAQSGKNNCEGAFFQDCYTDKKATGQTYFDGTPILHNNIRRTRGCNYTGGGLPHGGTINKCKYNENYCTDDLCPHCNSLENWYLSGEKCVSNIDKCTECINSSNITFKGFVNGSMAEWSLSNNKEGVGGEPAPFINWCAGLHPRNPNVVKSLCEGSASACQKDLETILSDTMNSSKTCSIQGLYDEITSASGGLSLHCKGNNDIQGEEVWLDEALSKVGDGYCDLSNKKWKCKRNDIPDYCKNGQCVLTGDTSNKKCSCPGGEVLLKGGSCGTISCKGEGFGNPPPTMKCQEGYKCILDPTDPTPKRYGKYKCVKD